MMRAQGFAQQGDGVVWTAGTASTNVVQTSYPFAIITVYYSGTTILAPIYSDNHSIPTPYANPFTANADGYWWFYAPNGRYDVMIMAPHLRPWTIGDLMLNDALTPSTQTPWLSDVDAACFNLIRVGSVQVGCPPSGPATLDIDTIMEGGYGLSRLMTNMFWNGSSFTLRNSAYNGWALIASTSNATVGGVSLDYLPPGQTSLLNYIQVLETGNVGIGGDYLPRYKLDVAGDVNSGNCYRILEMPFACSDGAGGVALSNITTINGLTPGRTPWTTDVNAAGYALENVGYIHLGPANGPDSLDMQAFMRGPFEEVFLGINMYWDGSSFILRNPSYGGIMIPFATNAGGEGGASVEYLPPGASGANLTTIFNATIHGGQAYCMLSAGPNNSLDPELQATGQWYTYAPNNTQLTFRMRGSDGVLREATLNLA